MRTQNRLITGSSAIEGPKPDNWVGTIGSRVMPTGSWLTDVSPSGTRLVTVCRLVTDALF